MRFTLNEFTGKMASIKEIFSLGSDRAMKSSQLRFTWIVVLLAVMGCSERHFLKIDPTVPVNRKNIGNGEKLLLQVTDMRRSKTISNWQGGYKLRKFTVSSDADVAQTLNSKVRQGLELLGFHPRRAQSTSLRKTLKVEILKIKSLYSEKLPRLGVKVQAVLRATCDNEGRRYQNVYKANKSKTNISPATFPNEKLVNATLSESLRLMFHDVTLLDCLSG